MIEIDGSLGEGGGQVLRSALTLSTLTRQPVRLINIRARRPKPGLQPQHLAAVKAAAAISAAQVEGMFQNSTALTFAPGDVRAGDYRFDIGTAGATSLVLQTVFLPLALASSLSKAEAAPTPPVSRAWEPDLQRNGSSEITLIGGTHVPWSPSFHYLDLQWLPYLRRMGFDASLELELAGFYPQGNGQVKVRIAPLTPQPWGERDSLEIGGRGVGQSTPRIGGRGAGQSTPRIGGRGAGQPTPRIGGRGADQSTPRIGGRGADQSTPRIGGRGAGQSTPRIGGRGAIAPLNLPERGALKGIRGISAVANLDTAIAERMRDHAL
ncbi:MAG: hypothetical protein NT169_08445, partial [Chloroflexi bacterium]|nr:hypothetical protein [Chloroflexota bacterium]